MIKNVSIRDLFQEVVALVNSVETPLYFMFGYWPEISNELKSDGKSPTLKNARYPFLMLSAGWSEEKETDPGIFSELKGLKLYLVTRSEKNLSTDERETQYYQAILEPLYQKIITKMKNGGRFTTNGKMNHEIEKLYYLRGMEAPKANQLSDFVEAIEISFSSLKVTEKYVCQ